MNFAGYVPLRRGLIAHTVDGRLTSSEALAFVWLVLLADAATGAYTINAPTLRVFLPGLSTGTAKRVLTSLQDKGYIYRDITPRSPIVYPYWVNHYEVTTGPNKSRRLDLSQVFATNDLSKIKYVDRDEKSDGLVLDVALGKPLVAGVSKHSNDPAVPDTSLGTELGTGLATSLATDLGTAHYNKKREKELKHENQQSTITTGTSDVGTMSPSSAEKRKTGTHVANSAREQAMAHSGGTMAHSGGKVPDGSDVDTRSNLPIIVDVDAALNAIAQKEAV